MCGAYIAELWRAIIGLYHRCIVSAYALHTLDTHASTVCNIIDLISDNLISSILYDIST